MTHHPNQPHRTLLRTGILVFLLLFIICSSSAWALTCGNPLAPGAALNKADAVFLGTVINVNEDTFGPVKFKVIKAWKGISKPEVTLHQGLHDPAYLILTGGYLIYAGEWKGDYGQTVCGRSKEARNIEVELHVLDLVVKGVKDKYIYEELVKIATSHKKKDNRLEALTLIGQIGVNSLHKLSKETFDPLKKLARGTDLEIRSAAHRALTFIEIKKTIKPNPQRLD